MYKSQNKFLSNNIYKQFETEDNFLYQLDQSFDWSSLIEPVQQLANNERGGAPRWSPKVMVKMLLLAFLYDRSDREMEEAANYDIRVKHFLGLAINEQGPDYTSLCKFRQEVLDEFGQDFFEELFHDILEQAKKKGIKFGRLYALDAAHINSSINGKKDSKELKNGDRDKSKDEQADWGVKGAKTEVNEQGEKVKVLNSWFGYKLHALCETKYGIATKLHTSKASVADINGGDYLFDKKLSNKEKQDIDTLTADKGYSSGVWINMLEQDENIDTAFAVSEKLTDEGQHQQRWTSYMEDETKQKQRKKRSTIERVFGDTKRNHGLDRSRYTSKAKTHMQALLTMAVHNLKKIIRALTGARFKPI
ncbi:MAG: transposase [Candidatus Magasanikbacteria bacterium]